MHKGRRFLAVIPARGGSRGLPRKNIRLLRGQPLLSYTVAHALAVPSIDFTVVTSDDAEILKIGEKAGAAPILRPKKLAGDRARTEDALLHALEILEKMGNSYDFVVTLEPTHPFRKPETVTQAIEMVSSGRYDSCMTLTEDRTDFWRQKGKSYARLFPNAPRRRQERDPLFKENSLVYVTSVAALRRRKFVIGSRPGFIITPERESLDIHTATDLAFAESLMGEKRR